MRLTRLIRRNVLGICLLAAAAATGQEGLPFRRAIELALAHSTATALSQADEMRGYQTYLEAHNSYIPQVAVGSDVGYAHGFPLSLEGSAPTLFNVTAQSSVWNPALREFVRAAKAEWGVSKAQSRSQREQVIIEAALTYIELSRWEERLPVLRSEMSVVKDMEYAEAERVKAGVDSPVEETKAKLVDAQTRLHIAEAEGAVDILRSRLAQLTGLPANTIKTMRQTIPILMENQLQEDVGSRAAQSSSAVDIANQAAVAKALRAKGEHKALYPTADFAAQYGLINTSLTNFEQFFVPHSFQPHNVTFGLVLRFPFLNMSQRARANAADAGALRARKEADQAKQKAALDALKLQHNVQQLLAARDVAQLRYELAQTQVDAVEARIQAQTATQRELQNSAIDAAERTLDRINTDFELQRAQIELLRASGELQSWALASR